MRLKYPGICDLVWQENAIVFLFLFEWMVSIWVEGGEIWVKRRARTAQRSVNSHCPHTLVNSTYLFQDLFSLDCKGRTDHPVKGQQAHRDTLLISLLLGISSSPNQLWEISRASLALTLPQTPSQPSPLSLSSTLSPAFERHCWICLRLTPRLLLQKSP